MRFVDVDLLNVPADWEARAAAALRALRGEIDAAESAALAAGEDPRVARKAAVAAGLRQPARQAIWRELKPLLAALMNDKCWYSESRNPTADKDVDHFRPKGSVANDEEHEGYWWLAFTVRNFRYSSQWCNQRRVNDQSSGGKADQFPLLPNSVRARCETDDIEQEDPELLDPIDPDDWRLLTFTPDGRVVPAKTPGTVDYRRAATSIETYHLHCRELVEDRRLLAGTVQRLIQELERLRLSLATNNRHIRAVYKRLEVELLRALRKDAEYSAAATAYAKAEVYKLDGAAEVKREWLEELLSAQT